MEKLKESEPKNYGSIAVALAVLASVPLFVAPFALINPRLNLFGGCYHVYVAQPSALFGVFFDAISIYVWVKEGISRREKIITIVATCLLLGFIAVAVINTVAAMED